MKECNFDIQCILRAGLVDGKGETGNLTEAQATTVGSPRAVERRMGASVPRQVNLTAGGRHRAARRDGERETDAAAEVLLLAPARTRPRLRFHGNVAAAVPKPKRRRHRLGRATPRHATPTSRHATTRTTAPTPASLVGTHVTQRRQRANGGRQRARRKASPIT